MFLPAVDVPVQNEMADFVCDGKAQAVFHARVHEGAPVHENGFQIAHEQRVYFQFFAQTFRRNQFEAEIEFGEFEDLDRHDASRRIGCTQLFGFLPDSFPGDEWGFEFVRAVQGWLALLMILSSFSKSSRVGFCPDKVRKNAGSLASNSSFSMTWSGMRPASTAA